MTRIEVNYDDIYNCIHLTSIARIRINFNKHDNGLKVVTNIRCDTVNIDTTYIEFAYCDKFAGIYYLSRSNGLKVFHALDKDCLCMWILTLLGLDMNGFWCPKTTYDNTLIATYVFNSNCLDCRKYIDCLGEGINVLV